MAAVSVKRSFRHLALRVPLSRFCVQLHHGTSQLVLQHCCNNWIVVLGVLLPTNQVLSCKKSGCCRLREVFCCFLWRRRRRWLSSLLFRDSPLSHHPSRSLYSRFSRIKRTGNESGPSLLAQKFKMANGRKHYLAQLEMSPLGFVESRVSSRNWSNQSNTATKLGITNAPPELPSVILHREKFYRDYFYSSFLLFIYIVVNFLCQIIFYVR